MDNREVVNWLIRIRDRLMTTSSKQFEALTIAIEKQEQDRWIPVTERLPEENGTYLACYEDATVLLDWFNGKWFFYRTNPAVEETGTIIAWRPLPEPYEAEEEA
jgi:hypothetical protein